jgi:hypothetical protein
MAQSLQVEGKEQFSDFGVLCGSGLAAGKRMEIAAAPTVRWHHGRTGVGNLSNLSRRFNTKATSEGQTKAGLLPASVLIPYTWLKTYYMHFTRVEQLSCSRHQLEEAPLGRAMLHHDTPQGSPLQQPQTPNRFVHSVSAIVLVIPFRLSVSGVVSEPWQLSRTSSVLKLVEIRSESSCSFFTQGSWRQRFSRYTQFILRVLGLF